MNPQHTVDAHIEQQFVDAVQRYDDHFDPALYAAAVGDNAEYGEILQGIASALCGDPFSASVNETGLYAITLAAYAFLAAFCPTQETTICQS